MNWFLQTLRFFFFGGDAGLCSGEIMGGGESLEDCGERERGLVVHDAVVEAKARALVC